MQLPLPPGEYTVDVVYSTGSCGPFPLGITGPVHSSVQPGGQAQAIIDLGSSRIPATISCSARPLVCPKSVSDIQFDVQQIRSFRTDPVAQAMKGVSLKRFSEENPRIVIDLPESYGGSREFDSDQVQEIAQYLTMKYEIPDPRDAAFCKQKFPDRAAFYDEYGGLLQDFIDETRDLRALAGS